jgi:predicted Zn finger-like uncharacterized protein
MSLLTRCPACATYFRVVPDQLRISEGWVKCGRCSDIFDASQHLQEVSEDQVVQEAAPVTAAQAAPLPQNVLLGFENSNSDDVLLPEQIESSESASQSDSAVNNFDVAQQESQSSAILIELTDITLEPPAEPMVHLEFPEDTPQRPSVTEPAAEALELPLSERWDDVAGQAPDINLDAVDPVSPEASLSFMGKPTRASRRQGPVVRVLMWLLVLLLGLVLAGQWSYRERDRLAVSFPEITPVLQQACVWMGCVIEPLRQVDALSVDAVTFRTLDVNTYRLNFVVKNAATLPLARPAVELVLTDAQDQPAYRRVFSVDELGAKGQALKAGAEWPVSVALRIDGPNPPARVLGYRLLLFYP